MKKIAYPLVIGAALLLAGCGGDSEAPPATKAPGATAAGSASATSSASAAPEAATDPDAEGWSPRESDIDLDEGFDPAQLAAMTDAERESNFLALLDQQLIILGSDATAMRAAEATCVELSSMRAGDDITPYGMELVDEYGIPEYEAGQFIGLSAVFFCPESLDIIGS